MNVDIFSAETQALQRELIAGGYLPAYNSRNEPSDDGYFGPVTHRAMRAREQDLVEMPPPAKPWWRAKRMQGVLTAVVGLIALFVPALREVDTAYLIELIWDNLDHVEAIITAVGALATAAGTVWGMFGAVTAKAPVDPMLVARVRRRDVRLPARGVRKPAGPTRLESVPGDRASDGEYWRHPRGPFDPE